MYTKKLILSLSIVFLFLISLQAQDKNLGKFLGGKTAPMPSWFLNSFLDLNEDIEELSSKNKNLILFIHQDNCPYCHKFISKNLSEKKTKEKVQKHFAVVDMNMFGNRDVVDTDDEEYSEKEFALKYKVQFTPTIIFFDKEGKQALRLNGYVNDQDFNLALDYISKKKHKELSFKNYISQEKTQKTAKFIIASDLFSKSKNFIRKKMQKKWLYSLSLQIALSVQPYTISF